MEGAEMYGKSSDLSLPVPAIAGHFGEVLETFVVQVAADQIRDLLGHDPRPEHWKMLTPDQRELYEYLQRKTAKPRRIAMQSYIVNRIGPDPLAIGALPALCVGVTKPVRFTSTSEEWSNMGVLKLSMSSTRVLLDGLARFCGAVDIAEQEYPIGDWFAFPVTIYAPSEAKGIFTPMELGQLFHDFNVLQQPVPAAHAMALDQADPYITTANKLGESDIVKRHGGMEIRSASLGKKSTALVTQNMLVRFVYAATEGKIYRVGAKPADRRYRGKELVGSTITQLQIFLSLLADNMGERFSERTSLHMTTHGWQALGLIFHDLNVTLNGKFTGEVQSDIISKIADIDWSRENPEWLSFMCYKEITAAGEEQIKINRGGSLVFKLRDYLRDRSELNILLANHDAAA
jgi:DNA-sulfur modification-associated